MIFVDRKRYGAMSGTQLIERFLRAPGFRFLCVYRIINRLSSYNPLTLFFKLWFKNLQVKYGFQIPHTCKIGRGLYLGHYGNIVINKGVVIGENCNIAQGVTIGNVSRGKKMGCPVIGDRVWIGANSVVVGKITIGNDVLIAPLSLVNFDVPDRSVVAGNPARIVSGNGSDGYIKNLVDQR